MPKIGAIMKKTVEGGNLLKKLCAVVLALLLLFSLCGCGIALFVNKINVPSEIYSTRDIHTAMETAILDFTAHFNGCSMKTIRYAGDEKEDAFSKCAERYDADEAIILLSDFVVGPKSNGSLSPFSSHTNWQWILVRNSGGPWKLVDCGYG